MNDKIDKIGFYLVHNNGSRLSEARKQLQYLSSRIEYAHIYTREFFFQPVDLNYGKLNLLSSDAHYYACVKKFNTYTSKNNGMNYYFYYMKYILKNGFKYTLDSNRNRNKIRKNSVVTFITDKHIACLRDFCQSDARYMVAFEDDFLLKDDSTARMETLIRHIDAINAESALYVDLAGGFDVSSLKIDHFISKKIDFFDYYEKATTNTVCVYLFNKPLAIRLYKHILKYKFLRDISYDWVVNHFFMSPENSDVICIHTNPSIMIHGSMEGHYRSWMDSNAAHS